MGVKGLWRLLMPIGRRVSIETLEGKILAVDASIWLTQFLKALRDPVSGKVRPAAHLIGFIRRLCKLRYQGIRPVFVFDGATPEIKQREVRERRRRREQFQSEWGSVQRTAKRLLVQQLKKHGAHVAALKKKKIEKSHDTESTSASRHRRDVTTATGAYAPDFYDPEMEHEESCSTVPNKKEVNKLPENPMDPEVFDLLEDGQIDYLDKATARVSSRSDWDLVAIDVEQDEGGTQKGGQISSQNTDIHDYASVERNDFDADYVASLPSNIRKDIVEDAQRKRRLQSRREFMKVAYDPEGLSRCQLRNFLKSTKLNQNIHKMAQQASKADGFGDANATDRGKRIVFEFDDSPKAKKKESKEETLRKFQKVRKLSVMSSSDDDSDDDIEWIDENENGGTSGTAARPTAILDDDDGEESTADDTLRTEVKFKPLEWFSKMPLYAVTKQGDGGDDHDGDDNGDDDDDDDDDDDVGDSGGFVKSGDSKVELSSKTEQCILVHGGTERTPISSSLSGFNGTVASAHDDNFSDEDKKMPARTSAARHCKTGPDFNHEAITAARHCKTGPDFNHEAITRMLQQGEYSSDDNDDGSGFLPNRSVVEPHCAPRSPEEIADDSEDEHINWEDGDGDGDGDGEGHVAVGSAGEDDVIWYTSKISYPSTGKGIKRRQNKTFPDNGPFQKGKQTSTVPVSSVSPCNCKPTTLTTNAQSDKRGDDESFEGKIGTSDDECSTQKPLARNEPIVGTLPTNFGASSGDGIDNDYMVLIDDEKDDSLAVSTEDAWVDHFRTDNKNKSKEMTAALEQAQATAANLTNWAGRAFRRAVAQHAQENGLSIPESAKPAPLQSGSLHQGVTLSLKLEGNGKNFKQTEVAEPRVQTDVAKPRFQTDVAKPRVPKESKLHKRLQQQSFSPASPETSGGEAALDTPEDYQDKWTEERNHEDGDLDTVTDEMRSETKTLLQLFGVPYVEAPAEAEAQCVMLEKLGLVDGIVTEDSDAFVFGGRRVYKNIFDDQKYVEAYDSKDAEKEMNLTRDGLIALAMLLGGDYTEGVKGVGIVNGMEIVHAFDASVDVKAGLSRFREWLDGFDPFDSLLGYKGQDDDVLTKERIFHHKHQSARTRWDAPKSFPSPHVMNAYLNPVVDTSEERFSWGAPDMDRLIIFLNKHAGWSSDETRKLIQPVVDKIASGGAMHQTRIESFMRYEDSIRFADIRSKRLREVLSNATMPTDQARQNVEQSKSLYVATELSKSKHFDK